MDSKSTLFLKLLINKFHPTRQEQLMLHLPEKSRDALIHLHTSAQTPQLLLNNTPALFRNIHYSWLIDPISSLAKPLQRAVIASFEEPLAKKLAELLQIDEVQKETGLSEPVKKFLFCFFMRHFALPALPREMMQQTPLDMLLDIKKERLIIMIDLLAMQDLAEEVRHIVDKKLIQAIIHDLTSAQQKYLQVCLHQKSKIPTAPLNVRETHKDRKAFHTLLHKRGLKRLSIATSGLSSDFMWHLSHLLDRGRGKILMEQWQKEELPLATQVIQMQIQQILPILKGAS